MRDIAQKSMKRIAQRLRTSQDVEASLTDSGADAIVALTYDPAYGARPVERYMESEVVTELSRMVLASELPRGSSVTISSDGEGSGLKYIIKAPSASKKRKLEGGDGTFGGGGLSKEDSWTL